MSTRDNVTQFMVTELKKIYPDWAVVLAKQNYPKLPEKCLVVDLLAETNIGNQDRWNAATEEYAVVGLCEATFNVQAYGAGSVEALGMLAMHLERPSIIDEFYIANIAVNDFEQVQDLTELLDDTSWEERASVDLTVTYDRAVIDNPGWFETVQINGVLVEADLTKPGTPSKMNFETNIEIKEKPYEY